MTGMTQHEIEDVANELRVMLQQRTCCPVHAGDVLLVIMAGFALDDTRGNLVKAAASIRRAAQGLARQLESGRYSVARVRQ